MKGERGAGGRRTRPLPDGGGSARGVHVLWKPQTFGLCPLLCVLMAGCGYIGDPLPPLANIPAAVVNLAGVQRGDHIIVHFTPPELTTEGHAVRPPLQFDLRIGAAVAPFSPTAWAAQAKRLPQPVVNHGMAEIEIPSSPWTGKEVSLAVRSMGPNHKASGWSNFVDLSIVPPPARPTGVKAEATAKGVRVTWQGDGGDFLVLRRAGGESNFAQVGETHGPEYLDTTAQFDTPYVYLVQRIVRLPNKRIAESDLSEEYAITPKDIFPPAAPGGLRALPAPGSIELTWEQSPEPDVAGYRVYRAVNGGALARIAETGTIPAYSDHTVQSGKSYRYAVTAVDRAGNESARSAIAGATAQ